MPVEELAHVVVALVEGEEPGVSSDWVIRPIPTRPSAMSENKGEKVFTVLMHTGILRCTGTTAIIVCYLLQIEPSCSFEKFFYQHSDVYSYSKQACI